MEIDSAIGRYDLNSERFGVPGETKIYSLVSYVFDAWHPLAVVICLNSRAYITTNNRGLCANNFEELRSSKKNYFSDRH